MSAVGVILLPIFFVCNSKIYRDKCGYLLKIDYFCSDLWLLPLSRTY